MLHMLTEYILTLFQLNIDHVSANKDVNGASFVILMIKDNFSSVAGRHLMCFDGKDDELVVNADHSECVWSLPTKGRDLSFSATLAGKTLILNSFSIVVLIGNSCFSTCISELFFVFFLII